jgi:hypothetical protein
MVDFKFDPDRPASLDLKATYQAACDKFGYIRAHADKLPQRLIFQWDDGKVVSKVPEVCQNRRNLVFYSPIVAILGVVIAAMILADDPRDPRLAIAVGGAICSWAGLYAAFAYLNLDRDFDNRITFVLEAKTQTSAYTGEMMFARAMQLYHQVRYCGPNLWNPDLERLAELGVDSNMEINDIYRVTLPRFLEAAQIAWRHQDTLRKTALDNTADTKGEVAAAERRREFDSRLAEAAKHLPKLKNIWLRNLTAQACFMFGVGILGLIFFLLATVFLAAGIRVEY